MGVRAVSNRFGEGLRGRETSRRTTSGVSRDQGSVAFRYGNYSGGGAFACWVMGMQGGDLRGGGEEGESGGPLAKTRWELRRRCSKIRTD